MNMPLSVPSIESIAVEMFDGKPCITSLQIAEHFGKLHKNVLQAIQSLDCPAQFTELNFQPSQYLDSTGRALPMYYISRDGFTVLAMGFTGKRAMAWKLAYIAAFNAMEAELLIQHDLAMQPPSLLQRRWLVTVDHDGNESFEPLPDGAAVVTRANLPEIVRHCFPEFALVRRDVLAQLEAR